MVLLPNHLSANAFILFGLLLLVGLLAGGLARRTNFLPSITGFMIVGFLIGPGGLGILNETLLSSASFLVDIALALILFDLGRQLEIRPLLTDRGLLYTSFAEMGGAFVLVGAGLILYGIPVLPALMAAAMGVSGSPAIVVMVIREFRARGKITTTTLNLLAMNNVGAFLLYTALLPIAFHAQDGSLQDIILSPLYLVFVSLAVTAVVGLAALLLVRVLRDQPHVEFAIVIGVLMLAVGMTKAFGGSELLSAMCCGILVANIKLLDRLRTADLGVAAEAFFIILFVIAGARLHFEAVKIAAPAAVLFIVLRMLGKCGGIFALRGMNGLSRGEIVQLGAMLTPMAGLAIGLSQKTEIIFPALGLSVIPLMFSAVAILETMGPALSEWALRRAGEIGKEPLRH